MAMANPPHPTAIAHGELLIDFVPTVSGVTLIGAPAFINAPGGAPANVAVGLARLGVPSGFMGQVGDDPAKADDSRRAHRPRTDWAKAACPADPQTVGG